MNEEKWLRLKEAFNQLYEAPPNVRDGLLEHHCAYDPGFARELKALLDADAAATQEDWWPIGREAMHTDAFTGNSRFSLTRVIGSGGFGIVHRAYDHREQREIALKVLRFHDPEAIQQFKLEYRAVSELCHPNLVRVHELFIEAEHAFFTMDLIEGRSITESLRDTCVENGRDTFVEQVCDAFIQLANALQILHRIGIIHRDLKPSNVLRDDNGRVVVLDFGLVVAAQHQGKAYRGGTPEFMAPEQFEGADATEASDWYAIGLMLFETLVGRAPHRDDHRELPELGAILAPPCSGILGGPSGMPRLARQSDRVERSGNRPSEFASDIPESLDVVCEELLQRDPRNRPSAKRTLALLSEAAMRSCREPASFRSFSSSRPPCRGPLVGRKTQLAALFACFGRLQRGHFNLAAVVGRSGMGKTALVVEFIEQIKSKNHDVVVLKGRCHERESLGYCVFDGVVDDLAERLRTLDSNRLRQLMPPDSAHLVLLFPGLATAVARAGFAPLDAQAGISPAESRILAFGAFRELLKRLAHSSSVLIFVDDIQWGDGDSSQLLRYLFRRTHDLPFLLIVAYRSEELGSARLTDVTSALAGVENCVSIPIEPLEPEDARAFVECQLGKAHPLASLVAESREGAPFLLNMLIDEGNTYWTKCAAYSNSSLVLDALLRQALARLSPTARRFVTLLAVAARPLPRDVLYRALGEPRSKALEAEDILRFRRLVRTAPQDGLETFHDRLREAICGALTIDEIKELHDAFVRALPENADPEALAYHHELAGYAEAALQYRLMAARSCAASLLFERAAFHYRALLASGRLSFELEGQINAELANVLVSAGHGREAATCYLRAAELNPSRRFEFRLVAGQQLVHSGEIVEGSRLLFEVLESTGVFVPRRRVGQAVMLLYLRIKLRWTPNRVATSLTERAGNSGAKLEALWALSGSLALVDTIGAAFFETYHLSIAMHDGDARALARALFLEAIYASIEGKRAEARTTQLLHSLELTCDAANDPCTVALLSLSQGIVAWMHGDFVRCLTLTTKAEEQLRSVPGHSFDLGTARAFALASQIWLGRLHEHAARLEPLLEDAILRADLHAQTSFVLLAHAHVQWLAQNDPDRAKREVTAMLNSWPVRRKLALQHVWAFFAQTEIALFQGDIHLAASLMNQHWSKIRRSTHMRIMPIQIWMHQLRARVALAELSAARPGCNSWSMHRVVRRELAVLRGIRLPLAQALCSLTTGLLANVAGDKKESIARFSDAMTQFQGLGMTLFALAAEWALAPDGAATVERTRASVFEHMKSLGVQCPERMMFVLAPGIS